MVVGASHPPSISARLIKSAALYLVAGALFCAPATAQVVRDQLWRGVWITLPPGADVQEQPRPVPRVRKQVIIDGVFIDLVRQKKGLPYGAEAERRWRREVGHRQLTIRERRNSYSCSYIDQGRWCFNRKIRLSSKQMVEAYFSVPLASRHAPETRKMRAMVESISLRKR